MFLFTSSMAVNMKLKTTTTSFHPHFWDHWTWRIPIWHEGNQVETEHCFSSALFSFPSVLLPVIEQQEACVPSDFGEWKKKKTNESSSLAQMFRSKRTRDPSLLKLTWRQGPQVRLFAREKKERKRGQSYFFCCVLFFSPRILWWVSLGLSTLVSLLFLPRPKHAHTHTDTHQQQARQRQLHISQLVKREPMKKLERTDNNRQANRQVTVSHGRCTTKQAFSPRTCQDKHWSKEKWEKERTTTAIARKMRSNSLIVLKPGRNAWV